MIFLCVSYQWWGQPMIRWAVKKQVHTEKQIRVACGARWAHPSHSVLTYISRRFSGNDIRRCELADLSN